MKDITKFAWISGSISDLVNVMDAPGSSTDMIFADAIIANKPTSILEEAGIVTVRTAPPEVDQIMFPVVRNKQFTWYTMAGRDATGSIAGSDVTTSTVAQVEYRKVQPSIKTAAIFLPDYVSLANKTNFELYSRLGAIEAQRKKEADTLTTLTTEASHSYVYSAGGFTSTGSVDAGSTLDPLDLIKTKKLLMTGSNISEPDFVLCHPAQFLQLNTHADFAPGATANGAMMRKARFNENGDIVKFDGMDIFTSELVQSAGSASLGADVTVGAYTVLGHPVIVGARGKAVGRGEHTGIKVYTEDTRLRHGQYKIFDISYDSAILVKESLVLIRAAD